MTTDTTPVDGQEIEADGEYITGTLVGVTLRAKPLLKWRPSYLSALRTGDFIGWAGGVEDENGTRKGGALHDDDVQKFIDVDATFEEISAFTSDVLSRTGEAPGKSGGPSRSSRSSRKK